METVEKKRILVIEDEVHIADGIQLNLSIQGYQVKVAVDGIDGLEKWRSWKPDLIVLDIMLPKMNGYEVCNLIKFDEKYKDIKILMLTAKAGEESKNISLETGADEYMTKDLDPDKILQLVSKMLQE